MSQRRSHVYYVARTFNAKLGRWRPDRSYDTEEAARAHIEQRGDSRYWIEKRTTEVIAEVSDEDGAS